MNARTVMSFLKHGPVPRSWRWPALVAGIGAAAVIVVILAAPGNMGLDDSAAQESWYWGVALVVSVVVMGIGLMGLINWGAERAWRLDPNDRERRISELTIALDNAVRTVIAIKTEIEEGNTLLADLERRAKVTEELSTLRDPQVIAITEQLRTELRAEGRKGLVRDIALGMVFFGLGVVVALVVN